jgi:hypothetical protein
VTGSRRISLPDIVVVVTSNGHLDRFPEEAIVPPDTRPVGAKERELGDFAPTRSVLGLSALALLIGLAVALLALVLLDLIGLITHLVYKGTLSTNLSSPDIHVLGVWSVLVPVVGGLVVGVMARFGSERIRGHAIGQAAEELHIRHHSVVELAQRAQTAGLICRDRDPIDHRRIHLQLTQYGEQQLETMTRKRLDRIQTLADTLAHALHRGNGS